MILKTLLSVPCACVYFQEILFCVFKTGFDCSALGARVCTHVVGCDPRVSVGVCGWVCACHLLAVESRWEGNKKHIDREDLLVHLATVEEVILDS